MEESCIGEGTRRCCRRSPLPARWALSILGMGGVCFVYSLRINMSLAIVCMVNDSKGSVNETEPDKGFEGEFFWDSTLQGHILSSIFYGYMATQIFGGILADHYGGKYVYGLGMLVAIVATMLIPVCARASPYLVIAIRVIIGMGTGVTYPAINALWAKWAPPMERSRLMTFASSGAMLGNIITLSVSGLLCSTGVDGGWPLVFYVFGCAGILWFVCWMAFIYNSPSVHPCIKEREKNYIIAALAVSAPKGQRPPIPWRSIATSAPVWAILVAHVSNNWGNYMLMTSLPKYMAQVLEYDIKTNGLMSAMPYVVQLVASISGGHLADCLRQKYLSTTATRKIFQVISFVGQGIFMVAAGFISSDQRIVAVVLMAVSAGFTFGGRSGYFVNHMDIAPRYAGVLFAITNTAATVPGIVAPIVVAKLTPNGLREEWQKVFFITAGIFSVGTIVYALFASGEEQKWAKDPQEEVYDVKSDDTKKSDDQTDSGHTNDTFMSDRVQGNHDRDDLQDVKLGEFTRF